MVHALRTARSSDAGALAPLLAELGYPATGADLDQRLARWIGQPDRVLLVAHDRTELLGLLALTITPRVESDASWAQVVAFVVTAHARARGIGGDLLQHAEQLSHEAGCDTVIINSSRQRSGAGTFYRNRGYRDRCEDHAQFVRGPRPT